MLSSVAKTKSTGFNPRTRHVVPFFNSTFIYSFIVDYLLVALTRNLIIK